MIIPYFILNDYENVLLHQSDVFKVFIHDVVLLFLLGILCLGEQQNQKQTFF